MSRTARLFDLLQLLRRQRTPLSGSAIADELGISLRTLYRDVATLQAQGRHLDGAPGLGYLLRSGSMLPPLTFSSDELEALVLGSRWVGTRGNIRLRLAARDALVKIAAVLPGELRLELDQNALLVGPGAIRFPPATRRSRPSGRRFGLSASSISSIAMAKVRGATAPSGRSLSAISIAPGWSSPGARRGSRSDPDGHRLRVFAPNPA